MFDKTANTNSADPDQTASEEAVWSGSSLFAILTPTLLIPALKTNILFENRKWKVFKTLEHFCKQILSQGQPVKLDFFRQMLKTVIL